MAGLASVLPAASVARTSTVCEPAARPTKSFGEAQGSHGPVPGSSWHSNVEPPSSAVKAKVALLALVGSVGPETMVVSGAVRSIVQVNDAGVGSVLPAASVARI